MIETESFRQVCNFVKSQYPNKEFIPLHAPVFNGNEKAYLIDAIDSTFVSSVGEYVNQFERMMCSITGAEYAVAIVNGTNALHMALILAGVIDDDEVISQSLTFIATCNAISYCRANPVFVDVDRDTMGLSPDALEKFLIEYAEIRDDGFTYNKLSNRRIKACVPMHTFGFPCRIDKISTICDTWNIALVEDSAESLGSYYQGKHTGVTGKVGVFSFNGNKTVTCGGGGALVTNDPEFAKRAKHLTTQAKVPHKWAFVHDEIGYNYRMPNLNAALACAQLEQLNVFVENKRELASIYKSYFQDQQIAFVTENEGAKANYWLNCILFADADERDSFLEYSNENGVMTRPVWELMHRLPMFINAQKGDLNNSEWLADRLVNIPSSVR
ncbi:LegC family aminotransferase [Pedobacter panaciterrae]|uniref:LegC family aminotransferase n=1 Tax=Pedobacter panaciterrae TaxID=363849 RepID=UPI00155DC8E5|nr:LegC family aminotransferase [Pedobacter panaciterrae]NQX55257.1 LegC family aminotransferase [Pedobacter panaciterrae]